MGLTSADGRAEHTSIEPIVVSELKLCNAERHMSLAHFVIVANCPTTRH